MGEGNRVKMARRALVVLAMLGALVLSSALPASAQSDGPAPAGDAARPSGPGFHEHQGAFGETDVNVCSYSVAPGTAHCNARIRTDAFAQNLGSALRARGVEPAATAPTTGGYGPADLQAAYNTPSSTNGAGLTVAIVDAYDDPNAAGDLSYYRSAYGLPTLGACGSGSPCFRKVDQSGGTSYPSADAGWSEEISLDLDMVSATCPLCNILLVEAANNSYASLGTAVNRAVTMGAVAVSNSYGGSELSSDTSLDPYYNHPGVAITVSSGDSGYGVEYPAASQYVAAVGGTHLAKSNGGYSETAWSGSGSGCSAFETKPSWQVDTGCSKRTVADVSAVADPYTGVWVYDTYGLSGWYVFGGTSVASPIVASVYALAHTGTSADQLASYPYAHAPSGLNDVVGGSTSSSGCSVAYLCTAVAGYDGPTGLGTPNTAAAFAPPVVGPDFGLSPSPATLTLSPNTPGTSTLTLTALANFSDLVDLTVIPSSGLAATFANSTHATKVDLTSSTSANASLTLQASSPGTYTAKVTGKSENGTQTHSATVTVTVPAPDFTITASPSSQSVTRGSSTTYTITITRGSGFTGSVSLRVSGLMSRDTASFIPNPVGSTATSSTLTIKTYVRDSRATRTLTITGTSGSLSHSATVSLTYQ